MTGDLTNKGAVKTHGEVTVADSDPAIDRFISIASSLFKRETAWPVSRVQRTDVLDGDRSYRGARPRLDLPHWPINSVTSLKENGKTLSVGTGYDTSLDVLIYAQHGYLVRQRATTVPPYDFHWAAGMQNIEITYNAGYDFPRVTDGSANDLPTDLPRALEMVVIELVSLMFNERKRMGEGGKSYADWNVQFIRELNPTG